MLRRWQCSPEDAQDLCEETKPERSEFGEEDDLQESVQVCTAQHSCTPPAAALWFVST